jgi:predicted O-methyltransferase YrrM
MNKCLGKYEAALSDFNRLIEIDSQNYGAHVYRTEVLISLGMMDEAFSEILALLEANPHDVRAGELLRSAHETFYPSQRVGVSSSHIFDPLRSAPEVLSALENDPDSYPASVNQQLGRLLYWIVMTQGPSTAVEVGTYIGYSAICIGKALRDSGKGHLHAFDTFAGAEYQKSPVLGHCESILQAARGHIELAGLSNWITLHKGDSSTEMKKFFTENPQGIDFAFIDGDHTIQGALNDWNVIAPNMTEGGLVLLHDTIPDNCGWVGPAWLLERISDGESKWGVTNLKTSDGKGLAIIQTSFHTSIEDWKVRLGDRIRQRLFHRLWGK